MAPGNSETQLEDVGPKGLLVVGGTVKEVITSFESQGAREYLSTLLQVKNLVVLLGSGASFHLGSPKTRDLTNPQVLELVRAAGCEPAEGDEALLATIKPTDGIAPSLMEALNPGKDDESHGSTEEVQR
ncbi:hypothetical protein [Dietzia kunjamensis]|uniref:hypothetical protein n=1 Tax=Dietzia kunjamensis TaxID=322509 RepID=UPI0039BC4CA2